MKPRVGEWVQQEPTTWTDPDRTRGRLSQQPTPVVFWFIDRPAQFYELEARLLARGETVNGRRYDPETRSYIIARLEGVVLRNWTSQRLAGRIEMLREFGGVSEEEARRLFPFREPGIWVEMSDGEHRRLEDW